MRRGVGTLFVAFLAVRVFLGPVTAPTQSEASPQLTKSPQASAAGPTRRTFVGESPGKTPSNTNNSSACAPNCLRPPEKDLSDTVNDALGPAETKSDLTKLWDVSAPNAPHMQFLIATVPDPVHTHLSLLFDRQVVAIEEAVQQAGYLFSSSYLPWDNAPHAENPDFHIRVEEQDYTKQRENFPGLLIFHNAVSVSKPNSPPRSLLVFLVGETPTGGIRKVQFANAVRAMEELCASDCGDPKPLGPSGKLFILGPTFSGSLYSLHSLLKYPPNGVEFSDVTIYSGTSTGADTIAWFLKRTDPGSGDVQPAHVTFRSLQEGNDYALNHLLRFACDRGYHASQVAVLSEDETAFGSVGYGYAASSALVGNQASSAGGDHTSSSGPSTAESCPNDPGGSNEGRVLHLYFPRDVSQLRNAYATDTSAGPGTPNSPPRTTLQLNLADTGNDDDSVNIFSHGQTPLSQEAIMMGLVADLKDHDANVVIVEATNPLDVVFLVRYLRTADPDARIVTVGRDLLLPHQIDDPRMRGVLEVTSYSLLPEIDEYITAGRCGELSNALLNRTFPSDYSTGTFNAVLALMTFQGSVTYQCSVNPPESNLKNALGRTVELPPAAYQQYGWPLLAGAPPQDDRKLGPPLWLTVLGGEQLWPVELLDGSDTDAGNQKSQLPALTAIAPDPKVGFHRFLPGAWIVTYALSAGFGLLFAVLALNGTVRSPSIFLANFAPVDDSWRTTVISVSGLLIFGIFLLLFLPNSWHQGYWRWLPPIVLCLIGLCIQWDLVTRSGWPWALFQLALVVGVYLLLSKYSFATATRPLRHFTRYRDLHLGSGVSPLVPFLLLIAGLLWACWHNLSGRPPWDLSGNGPPLPKMEDLIAPPESAHPASHERLAALGSERNDELLRLMRPASVVRWGLLNPFNWPAVRARLRNQAAVNWRLVPGSMWLAVRTADWREIFLLRIVIFTAIAVAVTLLALLIPSAPHWIQSLEGIQYDKSYTVLVVLVLALIFWETSRVSLLWFELRSLLMALDRFPLRRGFARLATSKSRRLWELGGSTFEDFFSTMTRELEAIDGLINAEGIALVKDVPQAILQFSDWMRANRRLFDESRIGANYVFVRYLEMLQDRMASRCAVTLRRLNEWWREAKRPVSDTDLQARKKVRDEDYKLPLKVRLAEDFVCRFYFNFIVSVFARIRALILTVAGLYVFLLLSFGSYPFEPASSFHTAMIFVFVLIVAVFVMIYGQAHKNATISRITGTDVGKLDGEFWLRLISFVSVPLLTLLATKFPQIGGFLFSWLQPATQAFK